MKLFSSDREPRPTPVVCGPPTDGPTDLSLNNASPSSPLPLSHRDYHRRNFFLRQRRAQRRNERPQPLSRQQSFLPLPSRSSATATAATGQRLRGSLAAELRTDGVEGRENQFYVLLPFAVTDIDDRGRKFATFCPRERMNTKFHLHLREISCQGKEKKQGKHSPNQIKMIKTSLQVSEKRRLGSCPPAPNRTTKGFRNEL